LAKEKKEERKKKERNFCSKTEYLRSLLRVGGGIIMGTIKLPYLAGCVPNPTHDVSDTMHNGNGGISMAQCNGRPPTISPKTGRTAAAKR